MSRPKKLKPRRRRIPKGAIPADPSQQATSTSELPLPSYYLDLSFTCRKCGQTSIWSAKQQKFYYEVGKATEAARPTRCDRCRKED